MKLNERHCVFTEQELRTILGALHPEMRQTHKTIADKIKRKLGQNVDKNSFPY